MPSIDLGDNVAMHYEIHGEGPPVLLAAGLGGASSYWVPQIAALARHFQVIVYDHRGTGRSTRHETSYTVDGMARDVLALLDALQLPDVHLIGHSTGGAIGQILAVDAPSRLRSMVLYASWTRADPVMRAIMEIRREAMRLGGARSYQRATPVFLYPPWFVNERASEFEAAEQAAEANLPGFSIISSRIDAVLSFDRVADLPRIRVPTLILCAEDDVLTPPYHSHRLAALIPTSKLLMLERGGHALSQVDPERFNRIVLGFVEAQERLRRA
ncbi:MAG: alpha/beta fold hydrolase [Lautropia sp.]